MTGQFRKLGWILRSVYWAHIPGSDPSSRRRNAFSYFYVVLSALILLGIFFADKNAVFAISSVVICLLAFVYFYEVVVTAIYLISSDFKINSVRLMRDIFISALYTICSFAFYYKQFGLIGSKATPIPSNFDYLYFSAVTFSTLGYGDFSPAVYSRAVAAIEALYGNLHLGMIAGTTFLIITEFGKRDN